MKKLSVISILVVAIMLFTGLAYAQSNLPGGGWWSGEQIQNVGDSTATIMVTAYDMSSTATYEASELVDPGAAFTFMPNSFADMPSGFQGSAVVSSDQPIKAIVNVTNRLSGDLGVDGGKAAAQYQGIDGSKVDTALYFPLVKGDSYGKTTTFYIQNAGAEATTATATFKMRNGDVHVYLTPSIGPSQMVIFSVQDADTFAPVDNNGRVGGLTVTASQPMAGVVMEHYTSESPATILQGTRGFTSADFDIKAYAPVVKNDRYGRFTGIQIQNVSGGTIAIGDITVTYTGSAGACAGLTYVDTNAAALADGESWTRVQGGDSNFPLGCVGSATVESTGNIVAIVNESFLTAKIPASGQAAVTSSAIADGSATTKISVPLFKDDRFHKRTGLQIQNVGDLQATNLVATFDCGSFVAVSKPLTVASGGAVLFYTPSTQTSMFEVGSLFETNGVNCAVTVTSDQPIVAIANESVDNTGVLQQDNNNYEGFNLVP